MEKLVLSLLVFIHIQQVSFILSAITKLFVARNKHVAFSLGGGQLNFWQS